MAARQINPMPNPSYGCMMEASLTSVSKHQSCYNHDHFLPSLSHDSHEIDSFYYIICVRILWEEEKKSKFETPIGINIFKA